MDEQRVHTQAEGVLRTVKVLSSACQVMYYSDTSKETPVRNGRGFSFQQEEVAAALSLIWLWTKSVAITSFMLS